MKRLELQGLRAIAVLAVLLFHFNSSWLPGGYLGVDAFFLLSGYLMAQILSKHELTASDIFSFYKRRLNRVYPAALFVAICSIPIALIILLPFEMRDYSASLVGVVTGTMNIMVANKIGYFTPLAEAQPLLHYWSLMVELHFYLVIPFVFFFAKSNKLRLFLVLALAVVSLAYAQIQSTHSLNDAYYLLPSRAWQFLIGVAVFLSAGYLSFTQNKAFVFGSILLFMGYMAFFNSAYQHPSLVTLPFILSMVFLLVHEEKMGFIRGFLSTRPLAYLGDISFSFYLWHNVILVVLSAFFIELSLVHFVSLLVLTFFMAHLTRSYVELPFLNVENTKLGSFRILKKTYIASILLMLIVGISGFQTKGFASFWKSHSTESSVIAYDLYMQGKKYAQPKDVEKCISSVSTLSEYRALPLAECQKHYGKGVLVIGDSHAIGVFRALYQMSKSDPENLSFLVGLNKGSCKVYSTRSDCFFNELRADSSPIKPYFRKIIYVQRGFEFDKLDSAENFLDDLASYSDVVWLGPRIEPNRAPKNFVIQGCDSQMGMDSEKKRELSLLNNKIEANLNDSKFVFVHAEKYDLESYGDCSALFWRDSNHWTQMGVNKAASLLANLVDL